MIREAARVKLVRATESALLQAYQPWIVDPERKAIAFRDITGLQLADLFLQHPSIVSPTRSCLHVDRLAMERDLGFDAYASTPLTRSRALFLAGYAKCNLPEVLTIPAIMALHQYSPAQSVAPATAEAAGAGPMSPSKSPRLRPRSRLR